MKLSSMIQTTRLPGFILVLSSLSCMMEQINYNCSDKNIPIPSRKEFLLEWIHSVGHLVHRMRFQADAFLHPEKYTQKTKKENFNFNSMLPPPPVEELGPFEDEMYKLTKTLEFRHYTDNFQ